MVEIVETHADGGLVLPAMTAVVPVEEQPRVLLLRHHRRRRADAPVWLPLEDERGVLPRRRSLEHDHRAAIADVDAIYLDARRRLEAAERGRDVAQRDVRDLLADDLSTRGYADQHLAAFAVQEGAERLACAPQLGGRALELERLGLAPGDE